MNKEEIFASSNIERQSIFDHVINHLLKQGKRSITLFPISHPHTLCRYRNGSGDMCAIGCLLSDKEYTPSMEGKSIYQIDLPIRLKSHLIFLSELQFFHDCPSNWNKNSKYSHSFSARGLQHLSEIAEKYNLTVNEELIHPKCSDENSFQLK